MRKCDIPQHLAESEGVAGLDGDAGSAGGFGDGIWANGGKAPPVIFGIGFSGLMNFSPCF